MIWKRDAERKKEKEKKESEVEAERRLLCSLIYLGRFAPFVFLQSLKEQVAYLQTAAWCVCVCVCLKHSGTICGKKKKKRH